MYDLPGAQAPAPLPYAHLHIIANAPAIAPSCARLFHPFLLLSLIDDVSHLAYSFSCIA
jgi:hypothetical protein